MTAYDFIELSPIPTCACACDPSSVNTREYENVEETNEELAGVDFERSGHTIFVSREFLRCYYKVNNNASSVC